MKRITSLGKALRVLNFYRWAFGDLTEPDSDIGMLAEYLVGDILGCLPPARKERAPYDLVMKDGTTIEVKAVTHKYCKKGCKPYYRWNIKTQNQCIKGNRPIADIWLFLMADFPQRASRLPLAFQAFDLRHWTCFSATGETIRALNRTGYMTESALRGVGLAPFPLARLTPSMPLPLKVCGRLAETSKELGPGV